MDKTEDLEFIMGNNVTTSCSVSCVVCMTSFATITLHAETDKLCGITLPPSSGTYIGYPCSSGSNSKLCSLHTSASTEKLPPIYPAICPGDKSEIRGKPSTVEP